MTFNKLKRISYAFGVFFKIIIFDRIFCFVLRKIIPLNKNSNVLIIIGGGVGDTAIASATLKHYREYFKGKKIYLIANVNNKALDVLENKFSDETIEMNFRKLKLSPIYAWKILAKLRKIGFETIIYSIVVGQPRLSPLFYGLSDVSNIYAYEGNKGYLNTDKSINFYVWFDINFIYPFVKKYFKRIINSISDLRIDGHLLNSVILHQKVLLESVTNKKFDDLSTFIPVNKGSFSEIISDMAKKEFFLIAPGAGSRVRCWPVERFASISNKIKKIKSSYIPVIIGTSAENDLGERLSKYLPDSINLVGKTNIQELKFLISKSKFLLCNDTGFVHLAIALKKPSVAIIGWDEGFYSHYGYPNINKWVTNKVYSSFYTNKEVKDIQKYTDLQKANINIDPRYLSISEDMVWAKVKELLDYLNNNENLLIDNKSFLY